MLIPPRIRQIFTRKTFHWNLGILVGGSAISGGLVILVSPILTRLYDPTQFGSFAVFNALLGMLGVIAAFRYECAILIPKDEEDARTVLGVSLSALVVSTVTAGILVHFLNDQVARMTGNPGLRQILWLLPCGLLLTGFLRIVNTWRLREKSFSAITSAKIGNAGGQVAVQIGLGSLHSGTLGLVVGTLAGQLVAGLVLTWNLGSSWIRGIFQQTPARLWNAARRYRRFPLISSSSALMDCATSELPALVIAARHGPLVAGFFYIAQRTLTVPSVLVAQSAAQVYVAEASQLMDGDPLKMRPLLFRTLRLLFSIGIVPYLVLGFTAPWLCATVFGGRWRDAGTFIQILLPGAFVQFLSSPLGGAIDLLERQDLHFIREVSRLSIMSTSLIVSGVLQLSSYWTILLIAASALCGAIISWWCSWWAVRSFERGRAVIRVGEARG